MTRGEAYLDLIRFFCDEKTPEVEFPPDLERLGALPDEDYEELQNFVASELTASLQWMTGIGTLEAIDLMVGEAINNSEKAFREAEVARRMLPPMHSVKEAFLALVAWWVDGSKPGAECMLEIDKPRKKGFGSVLALRHPAPPIKLTRKRKK